MAIYKGTQTIGEIDINISRAESTVIEPKTFTENGTYQIEDGVDGYGPVTVNVQGRAAPVIQSKSVTENGTYTAPEGVDGFSPVTVNVPTGTARSASDVTVSGKTVSVPAGLYGSTVSKTLADGTVALSTPTVDANGKVTASASLSQAGWVAQAPASKTLQLSTQGAQTITPNLSQQTIASGKYLTGAQTIAPITKELLHTLDNDFVAQNILSGVNLFGLVGTMPNVRIVTGTQAAADSQDVTITHNLGVVPKLAIMLAKTASMSGGTYISLMYAAISIAGGNSMRMGKRTDATPDNNAHAEMSEAQPNLSTTDTTKNYAAINGTTTQITFKGFQYYKWNLYNGYNWLVAYWD